MPEITLTKENFEQEVLRSELPVLVDFWADWCGPCQMLGPVITQIADETVGSARVGTVNIEQQPRLAEQYQIATVPTVIAFKAGEPVGRMVGLHSKAQLEELLR